ncbi:MAG: 50S ribosomal protein L16 [Candidatus Diapherotrites archaeon]|nr:50S ribosomal protein L16 [Candidatus Diapherotrites archaeon]
MGERPWRCYREINKQAYTRTAKKKQNRNYVRAAPGIKVRRFRMGEPNRPYDYEVFLVCAEDLQVRQGALEAARMAANRPMAAKVDKRSYFLRLRLYPHHVLRENKMMTGAGADRLQTGMSRAFGKKIDRAARVYKGTPIIEARVFEKDLPLIKMGFRMAMYKLPCECTIEVQKFDPSKLDKIFSIEELEIRDARKRLGRGGEAEEDETGAPVAKPGEAVPAAPGAAAPAEKAAAKAPAKGSKK